MKSISRKLSYFFVVLTIVFILSYQIIGQEVSADGTLDEAFFLIPFSWVSLTLGIIFYAISVIKKKKVN